MALPVYLAMTAAEIAGCSTLPAKPGYMACHFSAYGTGISNCPSALPEGAMLILNDRTPIAGHDPKLIARQLAALAARHRIGCALLDFQRPGFPETRTVAEEIIRALPCPVGISDLYAEGMDAPVFLPPPPLDIPLSEHLAPWQGREIWLEIAADALCLTLTEQGCTASAIPAPQEAPHRCDDLCCHYKIEVELEQARFLLHRTRSDLDTLLSKAAALGVTQAVGLYQELQEMYL